MTNPMLAELDEAVRQLHEVDGKEGLVLEKMRMLSTAGLFIKANHATLADMAKRLEAAERDAGKCWALHLKGPDDVVAAPSREAAEIVARNFNAYWDAHKHERDHDVRVVAEAIEWDHGAVDHARSVAEHWPEYTDLLDAAQEGEG